MGDRDLTFQKTNQKGKNKKPIIFISKLIKIFSEENVVAPFP